MHLIALSTLTFQALATVTLVLGAAFSALIPFRRAHG